MAERDGAAVEELTGAECRELLGSRSVGRLGVVRGGFPLIIPVNYAVHRDRIVVHSGTGTTFSSARQHRVCFEVDDVSPTRRTGWSVLVQGFALEVGAGDDPLFDEYAAVPLESWAAGRRDRVLLVTPLSVTGRRLTRRRARSR